MTSEGARSVTLYVATYNGGKLTGLTSKSVICYKDIPATVDLPISKKQGETAKIMLWETASMCPLIEAIPK